MGSGGDGVGVGRVFAGNSGGGGLNIFFRGRNSHQGKITRGGVLYFSQFLGDPRERRQLKPQGVTGGKPTRKKSTQNKKKFVRTRFSDQFLLGSKHAPREGAKVHENFSKKFV